MVGWQGLSSSNVSSSSPQLPPQPASPSAPLQLPLQQLSLTFRHARCHVWKAHDTFIFILRFPNVEDSSTAPPRRRASSDDTNLRCHASSCAAGATLLENGDIGDACSDSNRGLTRRPGVDRSPRPPAPLLPPAPPTPPALPDIGVVAVVAEEVVRRWGSSSGWGRALERRRDARATTSG